MWENKEGTVSVERKICAPIMYDISIKRRVIFKWKWMYLKMITKNFLVRRSVIIFYSWKFWSLCFLIYEHIGTPIVETLNTHRFPICYLKWFVFRLGSEVLRKNIWTFWRLTIKILGIEFITVRYTILVTASYLKIVS